MTFQPVITLFSFKRTILASILLVIMTTNCTKPLKHITNPALPVIKEGWQGNAIVGKKFENFDNSANYSFWEILKWNFSRNPYAEAKKQDTFRIKSLRTTHFVDSDEDMIVWLGQCSFFIRINGKVIVTDPSYYNIPFHKRLVAMPCKPTDIKNVDYMLVSHSHMDHLNSQSVKELCQTNPKIKALVPLRLNKTIEKYTKNVEDAGWYQQYTTTDDIKIFLLPACHWSRRGLFDHNKTLWGSFVIQANGKTIYFGADTRFSKHFEEVKKLFPDIDYALMPIGPFKPEEIMHIGHISPTQAVEAINILNPKVFIPMHFGTYDQSWEPIGEPYRQIMKLQKEGKINSEVKFVQIGEEVLL